MYTRFKMASGQQLKIILFLGSVREQRVGLRVAKFIQSHVKKYNMDVTVFDPKEMPFEMLKTPVHWYGPERKGCPTWLLDLEKQVKDADGFLVVSAEYNRLPPPALLNIMDHFGGGAYSGKPSGIVSYSMGAFGGMAAANALRQYLGELGCIAVSNMFCIPTAHTSIDEDGKPLNERLNSGAEKLLVQLQWNAEAMKNHKKAVGIPF